MIRITVQLLNANTRKTETLGVLDICNVSCLGRDSKRGDYEGRLYRKGESTFRADRAQRRGRVENYPRLSYPVWRLVLRMLKNMYPEEKG